MQYGSGKSPLKFWCRSWSVNLLQSAGAWLNRRRNVLCSVLYVFYLSFISSKPQCNVTRWVSTELDGHVYSVGSHWGGGDRRPKQTRGASCRITVGWCPHTMFSDSTADTSDVHLADTQTHTLTYSIQVTKIRQSTASVGVK